MKNTENPNNRNKPKLEFPSHFDLESEERELAWQNRLVGGISILVAGFLIYSKTSQFISWLLITKLIFLAVLAIAIPPKRNLPRASHLPPVQQRSVYRESTASIIVRAVGIMIIVLFGLIALAILIFFLICVSKIRF